MKRSLIFLLLLLLTSPAWAGKLSVSSRVFLNEYHKALVSSDINEALTARRIAAPKKVGNRMMVNCFVALTGTSVEDIKAVGGKVQARFGDFVTASVPVDALEELAAKESIAEVEVSQLAEPCSDIAASWTNSAHAWIGTNYGLPLNYSGNGVRLGLIDTGIQYNHLAFNPSGTRSGIRMCVYEPEATAGGYYPVVDGDTLPGRFYRNPKDVFALETDYTGSSHGTHTLGCAAASELNGYSGMAPEAAIWACGIGQSLEQTKIVNACLFVAYNAYTQNYPCVISISLGTSTGPHDGTSYICRAYDYIANTYNVPILLSAGNEGNDNISVSKTLASVSSSSTPQMAAVIEPLTSKPDYGCTIQADFWSMSNYSLRVRLAVMSSTGAIKWTSSDITSYTKFSASGLNSLFDSSTDLTVYNYVDNENNRRNVHIYGTVGQAVTSGDRLVVYFNGTTGDRITGWTTPSRCSFGTNQGSIVSSAWAAGSPECSINDNCTGSKTIAIGAYNSRRTFPGGYGSSTYRTGTYTGDGVVAHFSSYGTDFSGQDLPFVCAPGHVVVGPVSKYCSSITNTIDTYGSARTQRTDGSYDYWRYMSGTSMSTPVAAGIVALWLQADPTMNVDDVKNVIRNTAVTDAQMPSRNVRWGYGKIDALAGLQYIIANSGPVGDVNGDGEVTVGDVTAIYDIMLGISIAYISRADVNKDGEITVADITVIYDIMLGKN